MEEKEKIQLKDGTEYPIETGATESSVTIVVKETSEFEQLFSNFTQSNLSQFKILTSTGDVCSVILDKKLSKAELIPENEGLKATISLTNVTNIEKDIKELKETVDQLVLSNLGVK
jgi:hypothetical protein